MSVFTRNDKAPDPISTSPGRDRIETPPPAPIETKRPLASAQPMATAQPISHAPTALAASTSVISKALKITGQLESSENIQIDGQVDGDVRGVSVKVGGGATVKGTVYGDEVELAGTVDGKIEAKKVVLTATAHMSGDVIHQDIKIESGAYINGHCRPDYGKAETKIPLFKSASATQNTNGGPKP